MSRDINYYIDKFQLIPALVVGVGFWMAVATGNFITGYLIFTFAVPLGLLLVTILIALIRHIPDKYFKLDSDYWDGIPMAAMVIAAFLFPLFLIIVPALLWVYLAGAIATTMFYQEGRDFETTKCKIADYDPETDTWTEWDEIYLAPYAENTVKAFQKSAQGSDRKFKVIPIFEESSD
jgi:hypothetical protein